MNIRTHTCGELQSKDSGKSVVLNGWVNTVRLHGQVVFVDLRDRYGKTQIVFNSDDGKKVIEDLEKRCHEFVTTHAKGDSHETAFLEGQRSVLVFIKSMINKNLEE